MNHTWTCPDASCPGICQTYLANTPEGLEEWVEFHELMWHGIPSQREPS
jgi:hypothetical protein